MVGSSYEAHKMYNMSTSLQLCQAGGVELWNVWTYTLEWMVRLEALVEHTLTLTDCGLVDRQDEVSSARRKYKEVVGPTKSFDWQEVMMRHERGW